MYRTCLFCHADLGSNESLEHLQIGRRVAFDQAQGRLWVVCRKCERWNLTPFDDRFEAIEEGERLFRDTRVRFSTDEIGLARMRDGTELVRIGAPLRPEFAAWRYGDQFGRRRRRYFLLAGAAAVGLGGLIIVPKLVGLSIGGGGLYNVWNPMIQMWKAKKTVARLPLDSGEMLPVTQLQVERTRLVMPARGDPWRVHIPHRSRLRRPGILGEDALAVLEGPTAHTALQKMLPRLNRQGAGKEGVRNAVGVLEEAPTTDELMARFARSPASSWKDKREDRRTLMHLRPELRLALEMTAHEDAERRWLAGELLDLERAWREAEELAAIADKLGVPESIESRLEALKAAAAAKGELPK